MFWAIDVCWHRSLLINVSEVQLVNCESSMWLKNKVSFNFPNVSVESDILV